MDQPSHAEPGVILRSKLLQDWRANPPRLASVSYLSVSLLLAALYFVTGKLGLAFAAAHPSATVVWPPTGIALAVLLLLGPRVWPAVFIGAFLVNLTTAGSAATSISIALGNTAEGLVGATLVNRFAGGLTALNRSPSAFRFIVFAAVLSTAVSATVGVTTLMVGGLARWPDYSSIWLTWWLGDAVGALIIAPVILLWCVNQRPRWDRARSLEAALGALGLLLVSRVVFTDPLSPLKFLCIPFVLWAVFRFGQLETALSVLLLAGFAVWSVVQASGTSVMQGTAGLALLTVQGFVGVIAAMTLTLSTVVSERASRVQESEERFRLLVEGVKDYVIYMLDVGGRVVSWNEGGTRIKGYRAEEILGQHVSRFYTPEDAQRGLPAHLLERAAAEGDLEVEGWRVRKDGRRFWASVSITALRDDRRRLRGFAKVTRDLTKPREAELTLRELSGRILRVQDEEQRRIARELHDSTSPPLTALTGKLYAIKRSLEPGSDTATRALEEGLALTGHTSSVIRNMCARLHPALLDQGGLLATLRWYLDGFARRTGIRLDTSLPQGLARLPRETEIALFRIVEESLANVLQHSRSRVASVSITEGRDELTLEVRDSGMGIADTAATSGIGIRGMVERAKQLGGRLEVESGTWGTAVKAVLPRVARPQASETDPGH